MLKITGSITHPAAASVVLPDAYIETKTVTIREGTAKLLWSVAIWALVADKDAGAPSIASDSGSMEYDPEAVVDAQILAAMLAGTEGSTSGIDYTGMSEVTP